MALSDPRVKLWDGLTGGGSSRPTSLLPSTNVVSSSESSVPAADVDVCGCDLCRRVYRYNSV